MKSVKRQEYKVDSAFSVGKAGGRPDDFAYMSGIDYVYMVNVNVNSTGDPLNILIKNVAKEAEIFIDEVAQVVNKL